jgi:hypothetical protein
MTVSVVIAATINTEIKLGARTVLDYLRSPVQKKPARSRA